MYTCLHPCVCGFFPFPRPLPFTEETGGYGQDGESHAVPLTLTQNYLAGNWILQNAILRCTKFSIAVHRSHPAVVQVVFLYANQYLRQCFQDFFFILKYVCNNVEWHGGPEIKLSSKRYSLFHVTISRLGVFMV
jgi:hypothetical protein